MSFENISKSFPEKSKSEIKDIQKKSYRYLTDTFLEICKEYSQSPEELTSRVTLENFSEIKQLTENKKSILFLSAHTAPTEWLAHAASLYIKAPIDPAYKPSHNKSVDKFIFSVRSRYNATPIPYKTLAKDIVIRKNVTRGIAVLADLEPRTRDQAVRVNFLNQQTRFFLGSERVAKISNMAVYFVAIKKTHRGHYKATAQLLSLNPKELQPEELTKKYAKYIEQLIQEKPEAWLWTHRRWKKKHIE